MNYKHFSVATYHHQLSQHHLCHIMCIFQLVFLGVEYFFPLSHIYHLMEVRKRIQYTYLNKLNLQCLRILFRLFAFALLKTWNGRSIYQFQLKILRFIFKYCLLLYLCKAHQKALLKVFGNGLDRLCQVIVYLFRNWILLWLKIWCFLYVESFFGRSNQLKRMTFLIANEICEG